MKKIALTSATDCVSRADSHAHHRGVLCCLGRNAGIEFNKVGMFVKMFELFGDVRIGIDFFECIVLLQSEELSKFVECATIPVTTSVSFRDQLYACRRPAVLAHTEMPSTKNVVVFCERIHTTAP